MYFLHFYSLVEDKLMRAHQKRERHTIYSDRQIFPVPVSTDNKSVAAFAVFVRTRVITVP